MQKVIALALSSFVGAGLAAAGQIQIGGGTNGVNGLTNSYVTGGTAQTGWIEKNYDIRLFAQATENSTSITPPYVGGSYQKLNGQTTPATLSDPNGNSGTGVTFSMISDSACTGSPCGSNNFWEGYQAATLTIPVGVFDVTDVWTLMNNIWGTPGAVDTTVTFNFGNSAAGPTTEALTVQLTNAGSAVAGTPSGQISTSVECTSVAATCNSYAIGPTAASSLIATSGTGASLLPNITVLTDQVLSMAYNGGVNGSFTGSSGNVVLGDQGFQFGTAFYGLYLTNIQIAEASGASGTSETALSAITVDATPEPSTVLLFLAGFGAIGVTSLRKK